jgi:hypothetical protein
MKTKTNIPSIPSPGMGASYGVGSDRYPCTVTEVSRTGHRVTTRDALATLIEGSVLDGTAVYEYAMNPEGSERVWTRRRDGSYRQLGCKATFLNIGEYRKYLDPSF